MQLPIVFLCIVSAVSAAPQLFFVVPQQFLDNPTQQDFQNFIPLIVPFTQQQSEAAPVNRESAAVQEVEPVPEVAPEAAALEQVADVAVATEEPAIASEVVAQEIVAEPQPIAQEQAPAEIVPVQEQEVVPSGQTVEVSAPVETVQEKEQIATEIVQEPVANVEAVKSETSNIAVETPEVLTNELVATETVETPKAEVSSVIDNSGKSFNSIANPNVIHHSIVTHFGFRNPASVKSHANTFTQHGAVVDPKTLVEPQFRHFIYQNDSPDVVAAKIAFFRVQAALTPIKKAQLL